MFNTNWSKISGLVVILMLSLSFADMGITAENIGGVSRVLTSFDIANSSNESFSECGFLLTDKELVYLDGMIGENSEYTRLNRDAKELTTEDAKAAIDGKDYIISAPGLRYALHQDSPESIAGIPYSEGGEEAWSELVVQVGSVPDGSGTLIIARSSLCAGIDNREPAREYSAEDLELTEPVTYFTEVASSSGSAVIYHVWRMDGVVLDKIELNIGASSWRTWSQKEHFDPGYWTVTSETEDGAILDVKHFVVQ